eukprot:7812317-Pyramimonas_sp.AAC.1
MALVFRAAMPLPNTAVHVVSSDWLGIHTWHNPIGLECTRVVDLVDVVRIGSWHCYDSIAKRRHTVDRALFVSWLYELLPPARAHTHTHITHARGASRAGNGVHSLASQAEGAGEHGKVEATIVQVRPPPLD